MQISILGKLTKDEPVQFKADQEELAVIKAKAKKYTKGNVSAWVRYASVFLNPRPEHLTQFKRKHKTA